MNLYIETFAICPPALCGDLSSDQIDGLRVGLSSSYQVTHS